MRSGRRLKRSPFSGRQLPARRGDPDPRLAHPPDRADAQGVGQEGERDGDGQGQDHDRQVEEQSHGARRVAGSADA